MSEPIRFVVWRHMRDGEEPIWCVREFGYPRKWMHRIYISDDWRIVFHYGYLRTHGKMGHRQVCKELVRIQKAQAR